MKAAYIFIDESGDPGLDVNKLGTQPYFIYSAVIISEDNIKKARENLSLIQQNHFQGQHIKAKKIVNVSKRINVLKAFNLVEHTVECLIVDKSELRSPGGFDYKQSYLKFFQRIFTTHLAEIYDPYHIVFDKTGRESFRVSLSDFLSKHNIGLNLFSTNTYEIKDDEQEEPLLQMADFYANTIFKYYCGKYDEKDAGIIHDAILHNCFIDCFPHKSFNFFCAREFDIENFDEKVAKIAIESVETYKENYSQNVVECEVADLLLQEFYIAPYKPIWSGSIRDKLNRKHIVVADPFQTIGYLRSQGVLIVSPLNLKGFKLPCNEKEVADYFNRIVGNVIPQLKRGYKLNKLLSEKTFNEYNVLGKTPEFDLLYKLMNLVNTHQINK